MPRYKILKDHTPVMSNLYMAGAVIEWQGWPKWGDGAVEPADDDARRIFAYFQDQRLNPFLLATPTDSRGQIYFPAIFPDPRGKQLLGVREPTGNMPKYIVRVSAIRRHRADDREPTPRQGCPRG